MPSFHTIAALCLVALASTVIAVTNDTCEYSWVFIDIHYRNVDSQPNAYSYGLFMGAGAPSQNNSLWLGFHNETRFASNDYCGQGSPANCKDVSIQHGFYGADSSTTWNETSDYTSLDASTSLTDVTVTKGYDHVNLFTHFFDPSPATKFVLENHPISILSNYTGAADPFFNSASLGLGPSSTVLNELVNVGRIGRRVVGMYLGTRYPRAGGTQNGSIVLGGYDSGRIDGPVHEYKQASVPASNASPLKVHVKQLSLVTEDGGSIGLITDNGFDGYLSTSQYPVEFPQSITQRLASALNAKPANNVENTLQAAQAFRGNLTMTLDDGYQITFPSEWITNTSNITPFSASSLNASNDDTTSDTGPLIFGAAFLHHLYLTVDYESSTFSLADAKLYNNYVQPQSLCPGELPTAAPTSSISKFTQSGCIGAIIGGIIGSVGLTWFLIFYIRRRLQHNRSKSAISRLETGSNGTAPPPPAKSSLRTRTKEGLSRFSKRNDDNKDVKFKDIKRVSFTDSETSSINGITVTITNKDTDTQLQNIEMSHIQYNPTTKIVTTDLSPVSPLNDNPDRLSTADTLNNSPHIGIRKPPQTQSNTNPYSIPTPQPTPLPLETPLTGNPLLSHYRGFTNFDDNDTSDLDHHPQPQPQPQPFERPAPHKRTPSEQLRAQLGLTVNTAVKPQTSNNNGGSRGIKDVTAQRKKVVPLPLPMRFVGSGNSGKGNVKTKTDADYVGRNMSVGFSFKSVGTLFGGGSGSDGGNEGRKPNALSRMFPHS